MGRAPECHSVCRYASDLRMISIKHCELERVMVDDGSGGTARPAAKLTDLRCAFAFKRSVCVFLLVAAPTARM